MSLNEKYSPQLLSDLKYNKDVMNMLQYIAILPDMPNIILTGQEGSGKKVLAQFFLEEIYGKSVRNVHKKKYAINATGKATDASNANASSKKVLEMNESMNHIVIEATNSNRDKHILQEVIKEFVRGGCVFRQSASFKTIVVQNVEKLTGSSQATLRRTMEVYADKCRFIMLCDNLSKVIEPLRSRSTILTICRPSTSVIYQRLKEISFLEKICVTEEELRTISNECNQSMGEAIWALESLSHACPEKLPLQVCFETIIEMLLDKDDCILMYNEVIRHLIYDILTTNISAVEVINRIVDMLIDKVDDDKALKRVINAAARAEHNAVHGRRESLHTDMVMWNIIKELHS